METTRPQRQPRVVPGHAPIWRPEPPSLMRAISPANYWNYSYSTDSILAACAPRPQSPMCPSNPPPTHTQTLPDIKSAEQQHNHPRLCPTSTSTRAVLVVRNCIADLSRNAVYARRYLGDWAQSHSGPGCMSALDTEYEYAGHRLFGRIRLSHYAHLSAGLPG